MSCNLSGNGGSLGFGISIMIAMIITYLPQFLKIKKYESVYGISVWNQWKNGFVGKYC